MAMTDETILAAARRLPDAAARDAYLASVCGGDSAQCGRVEALLAAAYPTGEFLDGLPVASDDPDAAPTRALDAPDGEPADGPTRTHGEEADAGHDLSF